MDPAAMPDHRLRLHPEVFTSAASGLLRPAHVSSAGAGRRWKVSAVEPQATASLSGNHGSAKAGHGRTGWSSGWFERS